MKFLVGIACLLGLFSTPVTTNIQTADVKTAETQIVRKLNMTPEEAQVVYTYADEAGDYTFTVLSETEILVEAQNGTEVITLLCTYEFNENILTLFVSGEVWSQFTVNEDNTLILYEEKVIEEEPLPDFEIENVDIEEELNNLQLLIEALKAELEAETFNAENLAKILVALGGTLGTILLVLLYKLLRTKIRNLKNNEEYEKAKKVMQDEFAAYQADVKKLIESLESKVVKKIDDTEEKRQHQIEAQSLALSGIIEEAKKNLTIDEILNDE